MPREKEAKFEKERAPILSEAFFNHDEGRWTEQRETRYGMIAGFSLIGSGHSRKGEPNQDAAGIFESDDLLIFSVLDGLGAHHEGEKASQIGAMAINEKLAEGKKLPYALRAAHNSIQDYTREKGYEKLKPGATIVCAGIKGDKMQLVWEGDCMGFVIRDGKIIEAVIPDSQAQVLKAEGKPYGLSATVLKTLGSEGKAETPSQSRMLKIKDEDWIVLGSDGIFIELGLRVVPQNEDKTINYKELNREAKYFLKMFGPIDNAKQLGRALKEWIYNQGRDDATFMGLKVEKKN
ncbi:protein phosphatase 2C domain-containing protein [Patescibacteria group bacterium]|nr:protein phosphatase 2C domain-containing protein [Patescibacteria group bacterium]MBU1673797.1 protein phosphatase 2C domain-containing protein [Patescibacteria group bacterium]MBU1963824.1 protein phosphatase 2C domain-containing protein [Patescibacteria group bacterium]